ncbi:DUF4013 domain-containing protein [Halobaculum marinum]|uniref:DUF4013 domain-containing protein n=1 Tax=Halobaculum marinum TaxID=3031996 RepID=A0ABD5WZ57_9EURY|nr:DUF4013 domain-containing protein [Halobaculum sp. DT55]
MLEDALRYPLNNDDWLATLVIGGLLILTSPLVVPALVLQGYLLRVLRMAVAGEDAAPSFTDWGALIVDGIKLLIVQFVFALVLLVPFGVLFTVVLGGGALIGGDAGAATFGAGAFILAGLLIVGSLLIGYVTPAALTNMAVKGELSAAFEFSVIRTAVFSTDYLVGVLLGAVLAAVIGTVAFIPPIIIGFMIVLFYAQVVSYYCFGRGFAEATGVGRAGDTATATATTTDTL